MNSLFLTKTFTMDRFVSDFAMHWQQLRSVNSAGIKLKNGGVSRLKSLILPREFFTQILPAQEYLVWALD